MSDSFINWSIGGAVITIPRIIITRAVLLAGLVGLSGPASGIETEPLPSNIPVDPNVYQFVQRHFEVNPTQIDTAAYEAVLTTKSTGQQSTLKQKTTLRVLRPSIFEERTVQEMSVTVNGQSLPQKIQTINYSAGNGFVGLGSRTTSQSRFGNTTTDFKTIKIENITGKLFPIAVGNHFTFQTVSRSDTASMGRAFSDVYTSKNSCKVTRQFPAKSFHTELTGTAYLVQCDNQILSKNNPSNSSTTQSNSVYFDALGISITADPIDSQANIINSGTPSVTGGKYSSVTRGAYRLTSFSLSKTLICLHPVFAEEVRLLDQLDGSKPKTTWVAENIKYLRGKYCRLVDERPKSDADVKIRKNCSQYTGMFRGERVYWGACYG